MPSFSPALIDALRDETPFELGLESEATDQPEAPWERVDAASLRHDAQGRIVLGHDLSTPVLREPGPALLRRLFDRRLHTKMVLSHGGEDCVLTHFDLARLIGNLTSLDASGNSESHEVLAATAMKDDHPFSALFHATLALEQDPSSVSAFFAKLDACICLELSEHVNDMFSWFETNGEDSRIGWYQARCLTASGQADDAISLSEELTAYDELAPRAYEELGWAKLETGALDEAEEAFGKVDTVPLRSRTLLGQALVALGRGQEEQSAESINLAVSLLKQVVERKGFQTAEAWHYIGASYGTANMLEPAVQAFSRSLSLRNSAWTRKNLVVGLDLLHRHQDAAFHRAILERDAPELAAELDAPHDHS